MRLLSLVPLLLLAACGSGQSASEDNAAAAHFVPPPTQPPKPLPGQEHSNPITAYVGKYPGDAVDGVAGIFADIGGDRIAVLLSGQRLGRLRRRRHEVRRGGIVLAGGLAAAARGEQQERDKGEEAHKGGTRQAARRLLAP